MSFPPACLFAVLGLMASALAATDAPPWARRTWETDEGLPHNGVNAVMQRRDGFLWLATQGGFVRFDGLHFVKWRSPLLANAKSSGIRAVIEEDAASLLVASDASGLLRLRRGPLEKHPLTARFRTGQRAQWLHSEAPGVFWVGFADREFWRCEGDRVEVFPPPPGLGMIWAVSVAGGGGRAVHLARGAGVERYENGRLTTIAAVPTEPVTICAAEGGALWVASTKRLGRLENDRFHPTTEAAPWPLEHAPNTMLETRDGALWIGTRGQGLLRWKNGAAELVATSHPRINDLLEDDEGNVWVATSAGGLNRLRRARFTLYGESAGLQPDISGGVCEDAQGQIWFVNRNGLGRIRGGVFEPVDPLLGWPKRPTLIHPDAAGNLWIAAGTRLCLARPGGTFEWLETGDSGMLRALFRARDGSMWVGVQRGPLLRFRDGRCERFGPAEGFVGSRIQAIGEDAAGRLWFGSERGDLHAWDGRRFTRYTTADGLPGSAIRAIHGDAAGRIWVATGGGGLLVAQNGRFAAINETHGLPDDTISQLLEDDAGALWLAASRGLSKVAIAELLDCAAGRVARVTPVIFAKADGLAGFSAAANYQPAAWKTADGRLCFVGRKGLVITDPAAAPAQPPAPRIYLEETLVDGRRLEPGAARFPSSARKLEFHFTAPSFLAPERVEFRHRLEGFDAAWTEIGTQRSVAYNRLPPGRYRFEVAAANQDRVWSPAVATLPFEVLPAWWETPWARAAALLLGAAALAGGVRYWSHRRLKARLARLESERRIERERTRIARDLHDGLGASLTQAGMLAEELCEDWDDVAGMKAQSAQLAGRVRTIARDLDAAVWAVSPKNDSLASLCAYLSQFALEYFRDTPVRCRLHQADDIPDAALSPDVRHHLFLVAKEAMNNVLKHAQASEAQLTMRMRQRAFEVVIADNGRGFCTTAAAASGRNGLRNLRARAAEIGGELAIESGADGTRVTIRLPLAAQLLKRVAGAAAPRA